MTSKIIAICLLSLAAARADTLAAVSIDPSSTPVIVGNPVNLNVDISNVSDLYAFQFDIGFDPTILSATNTTEGAFLPSGGATFFVAGTIDNVGGTITDTADTLIGAVPGVGGDGVLATLQFQAIGNGTSPITLLNIILLDSNLDEIAFTSTDGSVTVTPEPRFMPVLLIGLLIAASRMLKSRPIQPQQR